MIRTAALAALALTALAACSEESTGAPPIANQTRADGPFWNGTVCTARNRKGRPVRVAPSQCPPRVVAKTQ